MTSLYDWLASSDAGARALAVSRLKYEVLKTLHRSLAAAGMTQADLAKRLGIRKSAVNQVFRGDGNLRVSTLAEYLHELGREVVLDTAPSGTQRAAAVQDLHRTWKGSRSLSDSRVAHSAADPCDLDRIAWHRSSQNPSLSLSAPVPGTKPRNDR